MVKILQVKLQQYVNHELLDVQAGFRKGRGTRDQIANICWIIEKAGEFQKNIYFCFTDYTKLHQTLFLGGSKITADGDGQGGLACCDSWGHKESDMPEQLY